MTSDLVLEVGGQVPDQDADHVIEHAFTEGYAGVVVKGSQGTRWVRESASELLTDAQSSGLQGAWLHYAEPAFNTAEAEAVALMAAVGTLPLGLGIWVEVEKGHGVEGYTLTDWLKALTDATSSPRRPVAILVSPSYALELSGIVGSLRVVYSEVPETEVIVPWAERLDGDLEVRDGPTVPLYRLRSTRGLVPVVLPEVALDEDWSDDSGVSVDPADEAVAKTYEVDDDDVETPAA